MQPVGAPKSRRAERAAVALASALAPVPALAHGPPGWLFWPAGAWFLFSFVILFVGSGAVVIARRSRDRVRERERALAVKLAIGLAVCGAALVMLLAAQGPWSVPFALAAALVSLALGLFAFVASGPQPGPP